MIDLTAIADEAQAKLEDEKIEEAKLLHNEAVAKYEAAIRLMTPPSVSVQVRHETILTDNKKHYLTLHW